MIKYAVTMNLPCSGYARLSDILYALLLLWGIFLLLADL
jgi:hypothetical protein